MTPKVDALLRNYAGDVPGAAVLVLRDGQPVVRASYGLADLETDTPATPETNYRLASITKQFTAASILLLAEDGRLTLDDRGHKWLPSLPKAAETVTIRHLLTHTSGLIDYEDVIPESLRCAVARRGCAAAAGNAGSHLLPPWHRLSVQQQRLCIAGTDRAAGVGEDLRNSSCVNASSNRSPCSTPWRTRKVSRR